MDPSSPPPPVPRRIPAVRRPLWVWLRGLGRLVVALLAVLSLLKALLGEKGLLEAWRARRQYAALAASLDRLRRENAALRERARRLRDDPRTVEELARRELGLRKPGELLVIVKDGTTPGASHVDEPPGGERGEMRQAASTR